MNKLMDYFIVCNDNQTYYPCLELSEILECMLMAY